MQMNLKNILIIFICFQLISITNAFAYIGPGMGGGAVVAIFAFFAAIFLSIWGVLYYPIKRALRNRVEKKISQKE